MPVKFEPSSHHPDVDVGGSAVRQDTSCTRNADYVGSDRIIEQVLYAGAMRFAYCTLHFGMVYADTPEHR
jgi:hypothetical protein